MSVTHRSESAVERGPTTPLPPLLPAHKSSEPLAASPPSEPESQKTAEALRKSPLIRNRFAPPSPATSDPQNGSESTLNNKDNSSSNNGENNEMTISPVMGNNGLPKRAQGTYNSFNRTLVESKGSPSSPNGISQSNPTAQNPRKIIQRKPTITRGIPANDQPKLPPQRGATDSELTKNRQLPPPPSNRKNELSHFGSNSVSGTSKYTPPPALSKALSEQARGAVELHAQHQRDNLGESATLTPSKMSPHRPRNKNPPLQKALTSRVGKNEDNLDINTRGTSKKQAETEGSTKWYRSIRLNMNREAFLAMGLKDESAPVNFNASAPVIATGSNSNSNNSTPEKKKVPTPPAKPQNLKSVLIAPSLPQRHLPAISSPTGARVPQDRSGAHFDTISKDANGLINIIMGNNRVVEEDPQISFFKEIYFTAASLFVSNEQAAPFDVRYGLLAEYFDIKFAPGPNGTVVTTYDAKKLQSTSVPSEFPVKFLFPNRWGKSIKLSGKSTVAEALEKLFSVVTNNPFLPPNANGSKYFVKFIGSSEFLYFDVPLELFVTIREFLTKNVNIEVELVERTSQLKDKLERSDRRLKNSEDRALIFGLRNKNKSSKLRSKTNGKKTSHIQCTECFELKMIKIDNLPLLTSKEVLHFEAGIYFGGKLLAPIFTSLSFPKESYNDISVFLKCKQMEIWKIPRGARVCITLFQGQNPLGWINVNLIDWKGDFQLGVHTVKLWPNERANPIGTCVENLSSPTPIVLTFEFECFARYQSVTFTELITPEEMVTPPSVLQEPPSNEDLTTISKIIEQDPLYILNSDEAALIFEHRHFLRNKPASLAKLLQAIDWKDTPSVAEAYRCLSFWTRLESKDALELLDSKFADTHVREFAVSCLIGMPDSELSNLLLQLVQALKYEPYHDSALARFLLSSALQNKIMIGQLFFWYCNAEIQSPETAVRYSLLMEAFLRGCSSEELEETLKQVTVINILNRVAVDTFNQCSKLISPDSSRRKEVLLANLREIRLPENFRLPLNPSIICSGLKMEECRVMDSAKMPLWLVFKNADPLGKDLKLLFKVGDDMRQDVLTLQMFRIMDSLWKNEGMDLGMCIYNCIVTAPNQGMLEIVPDSRTVAGIQNELGLTGVFKEDALANWIYSQHIALDKEAIAKNFVFSCAAYCVGTYVLGIGDRHNDNIMVSKSGHLFHIDFGHFLGNIKRWAGINRERAPFILTPEFVYVMGGKQGDKSAEFQTFVEVACRAYLVVRKNANIFVNLFALMLSTGIPELKQPKDIEYLRRAFSLDLTVKQATENYARLIYESLNTKSTSINFFFHNLFH